MLTGGVLAVVVVVVYVLSLFADLLARYIPFSVEQNISLPAFIAEGSSSEIQPYLQELAERIVAAEQMPEEITIHVHYVDDDMVNAFATLGGHVVFFRGLLEKLPNENALAMVMAHEIAHIKHRHPIRSLGRGVVVGLSVALVSESLGNALLNQVIGDAGYLTALKYSRDHEIEADTTALEALERLYGHVDGADDLFEVLQREAGGDEPPEFFSTHPLTDMRIARIHARLPRQGGAGDYRLQPLPAQFDDWVTTAKEADEE